ncbi:MAG: tRNA (adenosine(37)-N6)-threonylcarbamoyltransferase complex ATPase subunit type 1 TsaE [Epsilonproteobacteria bacterium]|nr:tRNA (adenosine(37)-N6)-threonylcarbamoyltransferase complex ATPase subunit type 1 TsaE [Campylobacterota bacterium]
MKIEAGERELKRVVECIERQDKRVILLQGTLGSGKTTLVKAFAKRFGEEGVTSPTFSIQQVYGNNIYHYDLYNVGTKKFMELGLFEELVKEGWHFIEWADEELEELLEVIGIEFLKVIITPLSESKREYQCIDS